MQRINKALLLSFHVFLTKHFFHIYITLIISSSLFIFYLVSFFSDWFNWSFSWPHSRSAINLASTSCSNLYFTLCNSRSASSLDFSFSFCDLFSVSIVLEGMKEKIYITIINEQSKKRTRLMNIQITLHRTICSQIVIKNLLKTGQADTA